MQNIKTHFKNKITRKLREIEKKRDVQNIKMRLYLWKNIFIIQCFMFYHMLYAYAPHSH